MSTESVRGRLVGGSKSLGGRQRLARWEWFVRTFPDLGQMRIIDLGGAPDTWTQAEAHPKHVHLVNLEKFPGEVPDWMEVEEGDACALPERIRSGGYDLVYSNSVLEHVGGHERRLRFADSVHHLAPAHWVQTPYRFFPVEPHWIAPGMQYFPVRIRAAFARRWPLAHVKSANLREALDGVLWTELVDRTQMRYYFPDSQIRSERLFGLIKSLVAIKTA